MRFVHEEEEMESLAAERAPVRVGRVEDGTSVRLGCEAEREADVAIRVTPPERRAMAMGEAKVIVRQTMMKRLQYAGLVDTSRPPRRYR